MKRVLMLIAGGLLLWSAAGTAQDAKTDLQEMQGSWVGTLQRAAGKELSAEEKKLKMRLLIGGDSYKAFAEYEPLMEGTLRLDPSQRPRHVDATFGDGPLKGLVQKGIYELKDGVFLVSFAKPGDERPRDFQTREDSEDFTVRYVREKK
jgi:uncharacterized protein (TIGR03067 family)